MKYDSFRVSAIFPDGSTIDNDIVSISETSVHVELISITQWLQGYDITALLISYYDNGKCIDNETIPIE